MPTERPDFYDLIAANRRRTWVLMAGFFVLLVIVGAAFSAAAGLGIESLVLVVGISAVIAFSSYRSSMTVALRSTRAVPASREQFGQLHNLVEELCIASGIPKPGVYVVHDPSPNAFATGRNPENAAVAVTTGLLDKMNRAELEGVVAHELAHIRNGDILVMTVAVATAGAIALLCDLFWRMMYWGSITGGGASHRSRDRSGKDGGNPFMIIGFIVVLVVAPLAAALLRAAVSRSRESLADATAVKFTRYPSGLRQALEKLDADITVVRRTSHATSHLWIESPDDRESNNRGRKFNDMFSTHPPLAERINLLREMEGLPPYQGPDPVVSEALRTFQDDRSAPDTHGSSLISASRRQLLSDAAARSVDLDAIFAGAGEVAAFDEHPDHARAGWYADPSGTAATLRYWDGRAWTDHFHQIPGANSLTDPDARDRRRPRRGRPNVQ